MERPVKKNDLAELTIESLAFGGKGIAHIDEYIVFVKNAIPGQKVKARILKAKSSWADAIAIEVLEKSTRELTPPCPYFSHCGGCSFQNIPYEYQARYIQDQVGDLYQHLGGFENVTVEPILAAESAYRYRNKMEFAFSPYRWTTGDFEADKPRDFALGLRAPGNYWKAIDVNDCLIAPPETGTVLKLVRKFALKNGLMPYNQKQHQGFLRHVVIKKGFHTDQLMVNIVTNENKPEILTDLADELVDGLPNLACLVNAVTNSKSGTTQSQRTNLLHGKPYIEDKLEELTFRISPASFFQTNTQMAEKLYATIREYADLKPDDVVWDLYCGAGTITLFLARYVKKIHGIEIVPEAIADAKTNAELNGLENAEFTEANLDKYFSAGNDTGLPQPDIVIIDPPRAGMHPKLLEKILKIDATRIVYVSCNPSTQVRDIQVLCEQGGYRIDRVRPVDMFPHTPHIEVVTRLSKTGVMEKNP